MKLKKLLGIITVVIIVVFSMMLTTSYAWYAFDNASTTFEGMTNNDDIIVSYQKGEYINAITAIPITREKVDMYSEKNNFNIKVKNNAKDNELLVSISLVDIVIDGSLQKESFKVELYHQDVLVSSEGLAGNSIGITGNTKKLADVMLSNNVTNNFELRIYILDDGTDQSTMENKSFQARIKVDVISRLKNNLNNYSNSDIYISSITVDGEVSDYIPMDGYYNMTAVCSKGSNLTWDSFSKIITYNSGSYINDNCSLSFTSITDYQLLSEMPVGSYVKYIGNNGCDGIHCEGYNANYVSDTKKGYCYINTGEFRVNGWRIGYVEDGSAHLISAGATDCLCVSADGVAYNEGCTDSLGPNDMNMLYEHMNNIALKYCNKDYIKGGSCISEGNENDTIWSFGSNDFMKITGGDHGTNGCWNYGASNRYICGYNNSLIDNGGYYWFYGVLSSNAPDLSVCWREMVLTNSNSAGSYGVRTIIALDPSIYVKSGSGTYLDPYIISKIGE